MAKVGFIGTGLMGLPMAQRLQPFAEKLTVYNRTLEKLAPLSALGATIADSGASVFAVSEVVVMMLTDAAAITTILFPSDASVDLHGKTVIQMGTIAPQESQAIAAQVQAAGGEYLEAPVLGSIPEAKTGSLIVMVGAEPAQFHKWLPLLKEFGPNPTLVGAVGSAATVKLALNQLIGSLTTAFGLSLALVQKAGVEPEAFMQILRDSALYAPTFDKKLARMLNHNYDNPNFPTKHLLKDMALFAQAAATNGIPTESIAVISGLLQQAIGRGLAESDYAALFEPIIYSETEDKGA
jgi:3-hydroxyisobutyrate dehydrogenase